MWLVGEHDLAALDGVGQMLLQQPQLGDLPVPDSVNRSTRFFPLALAEYMAMSAQRMRSPAVSLGVARPGRCWRRR
jgi:hypothetical protein